MTIVIPSVVLAAGAVCWRTHKGTVEVLLVHRDERDDVSLPKGKVDPGETPPQTAVREILEETGLAITLGAPLGTTEYTLAGGREKLVYYWSAEVGDDALAASTFSPNKEIASLEWLPIPAARAAMTYERDREVLDRFSARVDAGQARTFAIIALRHGKAVPPASWDGPDATRPLLHRGTEQAASVAPAIAAWRPEKLVSSPALRCVATIEPVAALTGLEVKASPGISQDAYEDGTATVKKVVGKRLEKQQTVVLCSHGPVLPDIIGAVARATHTEVNAALRRAAMLSTGHFTVLHVSVEHPKSGIVALETHGPLVD
ncbi:MAG TPA: NUDIX domain-containing protein [Lacisediminihabitans sp.]|nr:NUDIX domain-containing protein [Lacisediminihabitans sp.]HXD61963.1 NUDIX domain-containing protein [Lacisediminihabitans sp.]